MSAQSVGGTDDALTTSVRSFKATAVFQAVVGAMIVSGEAEAAGAAAETIVCVDAGGTGDAVAASNGCVPLLA